MTPLIKSLLILDDEQDELDLLSQLLRPNLPGSIVTTKYPTQAIQLAQDQCFDIILLDVTLNYAGSQFGGLEVYKALLNRYGNSSLIAYSQYVTDELLQRYNLPFNFVEKGENHLQWASKLTEELVAVRKRQSCFVAMPFGKSYDGVFAAISACIEAAGYRCVRVDQQSFTRSIIDKMFHEIKKCKFVIFVATGHNPNVFLEAGYAVAMNKEVITIADELDRLPFDVRDRRAIVYGDDPTSLGNSLMQMMGSLTTVTET